MSELHQIAVHSETFATVKSLAAERHLDVESLMDVALQRGINSLRQESYFEERVRRAKDASSDEALQILASMGKNNAPDPGDEIPSDMKHLLSAPLR